MMINFNVTFNFINKGDDRKSDGSAIAKKFVWVARVYKIYIR